MNGTSNVTSKDKTTVFISRRDEDKHIAEGLKKHLAVRGGALLELESADDIPKGAVWETWIWDRLPKADVMFLLFIDPSATWDWCLFEAGVFNATSKGAVICFHCSGDAPPSPISRLQAVSAEEDKMTSFLKSFFGTTEILGVRQQINKSFAGNESEIQSSAQFICEIISRPDQPEETFYHNRYIEISVQGSLTVEQIPPESRISSDQMSLNIFGLQRPPAGGSWTWADIEKWAEERKDTAWIKEVTQSVYWACQGKVQRPVAATFSVEGKKYWPNVHRRTTRTDGTTKLEVLLIHQPDD